MSFRDFWNDWVNTGSFSEAYYYRTTGSSMANQWSFFSAPHSEKPGKPKGGFFGIFSFVDRRQANNALPGLANTIQTTQQASARDQVARQNSRSQQRYADAYPNLPTISNIVPPGHRGVPYWDDPNMWGPGI